MMTHVCDAVYRMTCLLKRAPDAADAELRGLPRAWMTALMGEASATSLAFTEAKSQTDFVKGVEAVLQAAKTEVRVFGGGAG
jgi:hypothetical protein